MSPIAAPAAPAPIEDCQPPPTAAAIDAQATVPFDDVVVQVDHVATFFAATVPTIDAPFGRVPTFTLLRDGTLLRRVQNAGSVPTLSVQTLDAAAVAELGNQVRALGFERLRSHEGDCSCPRPGSSVTRCTSDGRITILRARDRAGTLVHRVVYADEWNEPATAAAVLAYLEHYRARDVRPYVPTHATLVVGAVGPKPTKQCPRLDPALLQGSHAPRAGELWAVPLSGAELATMQARVQSGQGFAMQCTASQAYGLSLVPWLPGANYAAAIEEWQQARRKPAVPSSDRR